MPVRNTNVNNLQRDTLRRISNNSRASDIQKELALLRIAYSEDSKLLTGYINQLSNLRRIYPRFNPTQASGRVSTVDPPLTNFPRACVEPLCQDRLRRDIYGLDYLGYIEHSWTDQCWSMRDCVTCDPDEILVTWDHDNIEGRIHDIIVNDQRAILAHREGIDLHTITCCDMFNLPYPSELKNPHTSPEDEAWRAEVKWQGKDTRMRVLAKNMNHGSKYTETWKFVYTIKGIEQYGLSYDHLGELARRFIASKGDAWERKCAIMSRIRREKEARSLYGFRRIFYNASVETGHEGFSHMISGTVSDYNNETLQLVESLIGKDCRLLHNAHDGDKVAVKRVWYTYHYDGSEEERLGKLKADLTKLIERDINYEDRTLTMTAGVKIYA